MTVSTEDLQVLQDNISWFSATLIACVHLATIVGVYYYPWSTVSRATLWLTLLLWQGSSLGITVGYHRLYSHRSFRARLLVRILVAYMGTTAMQGSIKWWCLRHRLHHRFTDDPIHDPYAATRGMFWAHIGWIFYKPHYERLKMIDAHDLNHDPVVRYQSKYYVPAAVFCGLVLPVCIGVAWGEAMCCFVWAGLVARILTWHCTFLINSLAHWHGLQPYSDDNTSKTNLLLAVLTCGEGNHNFHHAFPHDFRSGPSPLDWDPSKWLILILHSVGLVYGLRRARTEDVNAALEHMAQNHERGPRNAVTDQTIPGSLLAEEELVLPMDTWEGEVWSLQKALSFATLYRGRGRCMVLIDSYVVDVTTYLGDHPGGAAIIRKYCLRPRSGRALWEQADSAFYGGMNQHSWAARRRMRELRIAKIDRL